MTERFFLEDNGDQLLIVDNEGIDDYYHYEKEDKRDAKALVKLLNELDEHNKELRKNKTQIYDKVDNKIIELPNTIKYGDIPNEFRHFGRTILIDLRKELEQIDK